METHLINLTMKIKEKDYEAHIACICLKDRAFETQFYPSLKHIKQNKKYRSTQ